MGFFDGGAKTLSFGERGSEDAARVFNVWRGGKIVNVGAARQATSYPDRKPKTWDNGDPVMQLPITLDTWSGRCPEPALDAEDDGMRDYYITKGHQNYQAARAALRKANVQDFEVGGTLYLRWIKGDGKIGDPRQFEMYYEAPVAGSAGFLADDAAPGAYGPTGAPLNGAARAVQDEVRQSVAQQMPPQQPAAGGPPNQPYPDAQQVPPTSAAPAGAPPAPVWNATTGQWDLSTPAAPAQPATPPPPPAPVWNAATGQWDLSGAAPAQQAAPAGGPPAGVTNPFARQ